MLDNNKALTIQESRMITPAGSIDDAIAQFRLYQQLKEKLATADDFQPIGGKKHPKKSFVRKVQRFFNLSCELIKDESLRDERGEIIAWISTARAIHVPTGAYQDADGSCAFTEKHKMQQTIHNIRAHAITRAKNRAILDLVGFGDVSAEELAETADSQNQYRAPQQQGNKQQQKPVQKQPTTVQNVITKKEREELIDLADNDEVLKGIIIEVMIKYGYKSSSEIKTADFGKIRTEAKKEIDAYKMQQEAENVKLPWEQQEVAE